MIHDIEHQESKPCERCGHVAGASVPYLTWERDDLVRSLYRQLEAEQWRAERLAGAVVEFANELVSRYPENRDVWNRALNTWLKDGDFGIEAANLNFPIGDLDDPATARSEVDV